MKNKINIRNRIWLVDENGEVVFGGGRDLILRAVDETGSMAQAAKKLGMSYRAVWGKVKATEERLGIQLVNKSVGRRKGNNTSLTPAAKLLLERFEELDSKTKDFINEAAGDLFNFDLDDLKS